MSFPDFVDLLGVVCGLPVEDADRLARLLRPPLLLEVLLLVDLRQAQLALLLKKMQVVIVHSTSSISDLCD